MSCTGSVVVAPMQHQNKSRHRALVGLVSCLVSGWCALHAVKRIREALLLNYYLPV
jgi:hypothetical protein